MRLEYHPLFHAELENAALYYLKEGGVELAEAFISEVETAISYIE